MEKLLFIYWGQKFINAPIIVNKCLLSWKLKNPTWKIIELDDENLSEYINIEDEIHEIKKKNITKASYSDIIRIFLLEKYGGCWCDATTFCNESLDKWLNNKNSTGFFGFELNEDRLLSSWFLYSNKNNYIIKKWKESVVKYVNNRNILGSDNIYPSLNIWNDSKYDYNHYFWFHYLFGDLYNSDNKFKEIWDLTPKISADEPHIIQGNGLINKLSDKVKNHINEVKTPVYKLTYRYDIEKYNDNCNLAYLLNKIYTTDEDERFSISDKKLVTDITTLITIKRMDVIIDMIYCKFYDKKINSNFASNLYIENKKSEKGEELNEHNKDIQDKWVSSKNGAENWIESLNKLIDDIKNDKYYWDNNCRAIDSVTINENNKLIRGAHRVAICNYFNKPLYAIHNNEGEHLHLCESMKYYDYIFNEYVKQKNNTQIFILYPKYNNEKNDTFITETIKNDSKMNLLYKKDIELNEKGFIYFLMIIYQIHDIGGYDNFNYNVIRNKLKNSYSKNKITIYFIEKDYNQEYIVNFKKNIIRKYIANEKNNFGFHVTDNHDETVNISLFVLNNNNLFFANNNNINYFTNKYPSLDTIKNTDINQKINVKEIIKDLNINLKSEDERENYCIVGSVILTLFGIRKNKDIDIVTHNLDVFSKDNHNNDFKKFINTEPDEIIFNPNNHFYFFNIKCITAKKYLEFKIARYQKTRDDKDELDINNLKLLLN